MSAFVTVLVEGRSPADAEELVARCLLSAGEGCHGPPGPPEMRVVGSRSADGESPSAALRDLRRGLSDLDSGLRRLKRRL